MANKDNARTAGPILVLNKGATFGYVDSECAKQIGRRHLCGQTFRLTGAAQRDHGVTNGSYRFERFRLGPPIDKVLVRNRESGESFGLFHQQDDPIRMRKWKWPEEDSIDHAEDRAGRTNA